MLDFAADPSSAPEPACLADMPPVDPNLQRDDLLPLNQAAFGVDDPWTLVP